MDDKKLVGEKGPLKAYIKFDESADQPSQDRNFFLLAYHRDFYVTYEGWKSKDRLVEAMDTSFKDEQAVQDRKDYYIFPLEAYIHSGVALSLVESQKAFPDRRWDVSSVGAVLVEKKEFRSRAEAFKAATGFVSEWQQYNDGDVYGIIIEDEKGAVLDSCWGYYGESYATDEARGRLEELYDEWKEENEKLQKTLNDAYEALMKSPMGEKIKFINRLTNQE